MDIPVTDTGNDIAEGDLYYDYYDEDLSQTSPTTLSDNSDAAFTSENVPLERRKRQIIASNTDWTWDPKQSIHYLIDAELGMISFLF